ncbi:MAG: NAD(P)-dependent oxidoreductase [Pseudanabaenaceae cyanobacterium bins.68]|nr:NAD(P)-dependent oxidoreductase [Pseudanabaenaceae cyanobacterium bins.68]
MVDFGTTQILVTGAAGWLGFNLVKALIEGLPGCTELAKPQLDLQIRCLILPNQDPQPLRQLSPQIEIIQGDLRDRQACIDFCQGARGAVLFHTAGVIHPHKVAEFAQINTQGTINLVDAAIAAQVKRAMIMSSNSPCGCNPHGDHRFDENSPYNPYLGYGKSKMAMELAVQQRQAQIETVIIRAPWFYGEHQPPRQTLFFQMIRDGKAPIVGDGNNRRSMVYLGNLCQGLILAAISSRAKSQIYWIADSEPYTMNQVIDTVERLLEQEFGQTCAHRRLWLPGWVSEFALILDALWQGLGQYHQKLHVLSEMNKTIACSIAKARRELGYQPQVDLEQGMRMSLAWLFSQNPQALD